jgi:hypothetical protein
MGVIGAQLGNVFGVQGEKPLLVDGEGDVDVARDIGRHVQKVQMQVQPVLVPVEARARLYLIQFLDEQQVLAVGLLDPLPFLFRGVVEIQPADVRGKLRKLVDQFLLQCLVIGDVSG